MDKPFDKLNDVEQHALEILANRDKALTERVRQEMLGTLQEGTASAADMSQMLHGMEEMWQSALRQKLAQVSPEEFSEALSQAQKVIADRKKGIRILGSYETKVSPFRG